MGVPPLSIARNPKPRISGVQEEPPPCAPRVGALGEPPEAHGYFNTSSRERNNQRPSFNMPREAGVMLL